MTLLDNTHRIQLQNRIDRQPGPTGLHHHEAERAVIAALVRNPDPQAVLRLKIRAELFTQAETRNAICAILAFLADGITPDAVTLVDAVSPATRIEIETSLSEHATARLPAYVEILERCWREREKQAIRQRLANAVLSGAPPHEIDAITESLKRFSPREAGSDDDLGTGNRALFVPVSQLISQPVSPQWTIRHWIPAAGISVVFGEPSSGKSFCAIDMACCVATGRPWNGNRVKPGPVLYISGEGIAGMRRRFAAWEQERGKIPDHLYTNHSSITLDAAGAKAVCEATRALPQVPVLIVTDTLSSLIHGDENSPADMGGFLRHLKHLIDETGAGILTMHHTGHGDKTRERGHSSLPGNIDASFRMEHTGDGVGTLSCKKPPKDAARPPSLTFKLDVVELPYAWRDPDEPDDPVTSCVFSVTGMADEAAKKVDLSRPQRIALDELRKECARHEDGWAYLADWRKAVLTAGISNAESKQGRYEAFNRACESLLDKQLIERLEEKYRVNTVNMSQHC